MTRSPIQYVLCGSDPSVEPNFDTDITPVLHGAKLQCLVISIASGAPQPWSCFEPMPLDLIAISDAESRVGEFGKTV